MLTLNCLLWECKEKKKKKKKNTCEPDSLCATMPCSVVRRLFTFPERLTESDEFIEKKPASFQRVRGATLQSHAWRQPIGQQLLQVQMLVIGKGELGLGGWWGMSHSSRQCFPAWLLCFELDSICKRGKWSPNDMKWQAAQSPTGIQAKWIEKCKCHSGDFLFLFVLCKCGNV